MKRLHLVACSLGVLTFALFSLAAGAQVSAYGMVALSTYGFSNYGDSFTFKGDAASIGGGAFYNFPIHSRLTAGVDGRVLYGPGGNGGTTADAALRIGVVPHKNPLRPYFEIGGGIVSSVRDPGFDPTRITSGAAEFLGGLDIRLTESVDLRAIEYGAAAGSSNSGPASAAAFVDAGIVYHFHPSRRH